MTELGSGNSGTAVLSDLLGAGGLADNVIYVLEAVAKVCESFAETGGTCLVSGGDQTSVILIPAAKTPENNGEVTVVLSYLDNCVSGYPARNAEYERFELLFCKSVNCLLYILFLVIVGNGEYRYQLKTLCLKLFLCRSTLSYDNVNGSVYLTEAYKTYFFSLP